MGGLANCRIRTSFFSFKFDMSMVYLVSATSPTGVKPSRVFDYFYAHLMV